MYRTVAICLMLLSAGCGNGGDADTGPAGPGQAPSEAARGGTISVGALSWTIVPAIQCSVFPGGIVSIAGHAAEDENVEIVIDYGGPDGARVGSDGSADAWRAVPGTLVVEIDGKRVRGRADFAQGFSNDAGTQSGSFDVRCG